MFNNIGGKIKALAKWITGLGIVASALSGIGMASDSYFRPGNIPLGIMVFLGGALLAWLSGFFIYGFGQLIEHAQSIDRKLDGLGAAWKAPDQHLQGHRPPEDKL